MGFVNPIAGATEWSDELFLTVNTSPSADSGTDEEQAVAHIPFDFVVGEMLLRAGPYAIEPSTLRGMLMIRRADCDSQPMLVQAIGTVDRRQAIPSKLLFYCQQNLYFLAHVLTGSN